MISLTQILLRILLACLMGSVIGLERQRRDWTAGLRTHMLVCMGAALFMLVSMHGFTDVVGQKGIELDPSRVAAQVVSGIGFIGAGTIMFVRQQVIKGLTTAAGLWTVAAIGLAVGGGMYGAAVLTTVLALIILALIKPLELRYFKAGQTDLIRISVQQGNKLVDQLDPLLKELHLGYTHIDLKKVEDGTDEISITLVKQDVKNVNKLQVLQQIQTLDGVQKAEFILQ